MAGPLTTVRNRRGRRDRRVLLLLSWLVVLLHAVALLALRQWLQPPSLLREMAPPFYTRSIVPEAPPAPVVATAPVQAQPARPAGPTARIRQPRPPAARRAGKRAEPAPVDADAVAQEKAEAASDPVAAAAPELPASTPLAAASESEAVMAPPAPEPEPAQAAAPPEPLAEPAPAATDAVPAFLASWPSDTRLNYQLGGYYRGELHGDARVLWQREGTRYHTAVEMSAGLLASLSFSSQGEITAAGLRPEVYEENVRGRRRGVRIGDAEVRLNNGTRVPRPASVQDTASQFVELGHRFSSGQVKLEPGAQVHFSMARPGGIDDWVYDVISEETLHLPRLGPVQALHLKPRPLAKPRGPITAEIWYAPSLQYLPVRIRINQGPDTYIDLIVETVEQR